MYGQQNNHKTDNRKTDDDYSDIGVEHIPSAPNEKAQSQDENQSQFNPKNLAVTIASILGAGGMGATYWFLSSTGIKDMPEMPIITPILRYASSPDSALVNFAQCFLAFSDLPDRISKLYENYFAGAEYAFARKVVFTLIMASAFAWASLSAVPMLSAASAAFPIEALSYGALALRALLVFGSFLKFPDICSSLKGKFKEAFDKLIAVKDVFQGDLSEAATAFKGVVDLGLLISSLAIALFYTFNQHTSITKGLNAWGDYENVSVIIQAVIELLALIPLSALNAEFIGNGINQGAEKIAKITESLGVLLGILKEVKHKSLNHEGEIATETIAITTCKQQFLTESIYPIVRALIELATAILSGAPAMLLALVGTEAGGASAEIPKTMLPFEGEKIYKLAESLNAFIAGAASNLPGMTHIFNKLEVLFEQLRAWCSSDNSSPYDSIPDSKSNAGTSCCCPWWEASAAQAGQEAGIGELRISDLGKGDNSSSNSDIEQGTGEPSSESSRSSFLCCAPCWD